MVGLLLGLESPPKSADASDALAVAICHANASQTQDLVISE
jgi:Holliday junction resolvasome RuvABC endonuclease subunit